MNDFSFDELLSAYVDGELTAPERAEVERQLAASPAARKKLEELRRLSGLVKELPRKTLPSEFAAEVMQAAERRMLLPETVAVQRSRRALRWALAIGAPLTAAAMLLVAFNLYNPPQPALDMRMVQQASLPPADNSVADDRSVAARSPSARDVASASRESEKAGAYADAPGAGSPARAMGTAPAGPAAKPFAKTPASIDDPGSQAAIAAVRKQALKNAEVGQVVEEILRNDAGERVAVIKLYVVDRTEGFDLVQVALERNAVPGDVPVRAASKKADGDTVAREPAGQSFQDRDALFVFARSHQLSAALDAVLAAKDSVVGMEVQPPMELAQLDSQSQKRVLEVSDLRDQPTRRSNADDRPSDIPAADKIPAPPGNAPSRSASKSADPAKSAPAKPRPAAPPAEGKTQTLEKTEIQATSPKREEPSSRTVDGQEEESAFGNARQVVVRLRGEMSKDSVLASQRPAKGNKPGLESLSPPPMPKELSPRADRATTKRTGSGENARQKLAAEEQPLQVIIVIEQRPSRPDRPAPPDKPQPSVDGAAS